MARREKKKEATGWEAALEDIGMEPSDDDAVLRDGEDPDSDGDVDDVGEGSDANSVVCDSGAASSSKSDSVGESADGEGCGRVPRSGHCRWGRVATH